MLITSRRTLSAAWLALALVAIFAPIFYGVAHSNIHFFRADYLSHYKIALRIQNGEALGVPHIFYHILIIGLKSLLPSESPSQLSALLMIGFRALLGVWLFLILRAQLSARLSSWWIGVMVVLFLLTAPLYLWRDAIDTSGNIDFIRHFTGYLNPLVYHNPTQNLMLIFVVPVSLIALRAVVPQPFQNARQRFILTALSAVLVMLMSLSKPSYSIALFPALGLVVLYRVVRRLPVDWWLLVVGLGLPFLFVLVLQYAVAYADPQRAAIQMGGLVFFRTQGFQVWEVALKCVLSVFFPLVAHLLHAKHALKDDYLNISWLVFGVSLIWSYFFYESGSRLSHGNFVWSAYAALFVLMFSTLLFLLKHYTARSAKRTLGTLLTVIAFGLQIVAGLYAYCVILTYVLFT